MSSESKEPKELKSERLPFEPAQTRKKPVQKADSKPAADKGTRKPAKKSSTERRKSSQAEKPPDSPTAKQPKTSKVRRSTPDQLGIPKVVSDRMARRMVSFCALPTLLGMLTFVVSYFVVTQGWFKLPNVVVLLVSMGWLGLGVIGLSYGILSASWDEERVGTRLGYEEFSTNFGRLRAAWKESREKTTIGD
ncbi:photosystem II biosynthesis protein [Phormidesmis priestleyi]